MAEVVIKLVVNKLCDAVLQEIFSLCKVDGKVEQVKRELTRIQCFLKDADHKRGRDEGVRNWVNELRDMSHRIEDTIDIFVLEVGESSVKKSSVMEKVKKLFKKPEKLVAIHKFGKEIDKILAQINEIAESTVKYGIKYLDENSASELVVPFKRPLIPDLNETELVVEEKIVEQLLDQNQLRRSVVSIVGPGGLGKSTVAEKAYSSYEVKSKFEVRIWLSISQNFKLIHILKKMLEEITGVKDDVDREEDYLMKEVKKLLLEKKYLIVLDDVWSENLWPQITPVLPDMKNGSRIIITSRSYNVPKAADPTSEPFKLRFLNEDESLELLFKTALRDKYTTNYFPIDLLDIAKQLVQKCDGLPLALIVLGGILSVKLPTRYMWENVSKNMVWSEQGKECMDILTSSYDHMHATLKSCFMYLSCFPEDYTIYAEDLIRLWVAEGLIPHIPEKILEDTAEDYLEQLAQRSMIQVTSRLPHNDSIEQLKMHDLLRDLAIQKAEEVNYLTTCSDEKESVLGGARRVAIHCSDCDDLMKSASRHIRSLLCFHSVPNYCGYKLLRVLSHNRGYKSEDIDIERFHGLTLLRYFKIGWSINESKPGQFDKVVSSMKNLQTLDFRSFQHKKLPDCIWNIKTLRHVMLCLYTLGPPPSTDLKNLQTLLGIKNRESWGSNDLPNLPNLTSLDIEIITQGFQMGVVVAFLQTLKNLVTLSIEGRDIPMELVDLRGFLFYEHLADMVYKGSFKEYSPEMALDVGFFPIHITRISFYGPSVRQDHITLFGNLHGLKVLIIRLGAYNGKKMRFSSGAFPQLKSLFVEGLGELEEMEIEEGTMPILSELIISSFPLLQVPFGLQYLTTLRQISYSFMWDNSCETKEKEIRNLCKHVPSIDIGDISEEDSD